MIPAYGCRVAMKTASFASYASTAPRYSMYKAPASRTDPTMSVAQCTPETCLPATMKAENTMTNIAVALLGDALSDLLPTWSFNVGITLSTSSVAYELEFSSRACGPGVCESSPQFSYCSDASAIAASTSRRWYSDGRAHRLRRPRGPPQRTRCRKRSNRPMPHASAVTLPRSPRDLQS